jgi:phage host-nuclease inhibitor protein Gam
MEVQRSGPVSEATLQLQDIRQVLSRTVSKLETQIGDSESTVEEQPDDTLDDIQIKIKESQKRLCK